jgi:hypothetical protein
MAFQEIQEQTDVVAARVIVPMQGKQRLNQLFGRLLGVIAEGLVVEGGGANGWIRG